MDFTDVVKQKFIELSETQKKIAKYVLDHLDEVVFYTANQLGEKVSVSETTIIRFSYALGFSGFSDMSKVMRDNVLQSIKNMKQGDSDAVTLSELSPIQLLDYLETQATQGNWAYSNIDINDFKNICEAIMTKKRIRIIGYMDSFGVAAEMLHLLNKFRNNVHYLELLNKENALHDIDEDSLIIAISFSPHYKYTLEHTRIAKKGGCKLITLTDSIINSFTDLSDYSLVFNLERNSEIDLIDLSPVTRFNYFLSNYLYSNYRSEIDKYRSSVKIPVE